jgi:hypothetical protein
MFMDTSSGGGYSEQYVSAGSSHDLTVRADRRGDADSLVEVAWSRSKIGAALLRLMREWDGAAKQGLRFDQAFLQMKALPDVRGAMVVWALGNTALPPRREQHEEANDLSWAVLSWWLDRACTACAGTGWVQRAKVANQPCRTCHGSREKAIPHGQFGRALVAHMESCLYRHRASVKGRAGR